MTDWLLRSCPICGADLYRDDSEPTFSCLACGREYTADGEHVLPVRSIAVLKPAAKHRARGLPVRTAGH